MTINIVSPGLIVAGSTIAGQVDTEVGGGDLVYDEQRLAGSLQPTSEIEDAYDGWTRRRLSVSIYLARQVPSGSLGPYAALALLRRVARGAGEEPEEHTIIGPLADALRFDVPWVSAGEPSVRAGLNIEVTLRFLELQPDAVSANAAAFDPGSDAPDDPADPDPDDSLTDEQRARIEEFELGDDGGE